VQHDDVGGDDWPGLGIEDAAGDRLREGGRRQYDEKEGENERDDEWKSPEGTGH
jgi:hypothetical protein